MITPQQSIQARLGKNVSFDGYPGECLSWVKQFMQDTQGINPPAAPDGGAKGYWDQFPDPLSKYYVKIANNHADSRQIPEQYDIIIWDGNVPGSQGYGHIAVFNQGTPGSATFGSWDENWGNNQTVHTVMHVWEGQGTILGWLRPIRWPVTQAVKTANVPQQAPVQAVPQRAQFTVTLPKLNADGTADNVWHLYNVQGPYDIPHAKAVLNPFEFNGLTYNIEGFVDNKQGVIITTQDFGQGAIWIQGTNAVING